MVPLQERLVSLPSLALYALTLLKYKIDLHMESHEWCYYVISLIMIICHIPGIIWNFYMHTPCIYAHIKFCTSMKDYNLLLGGAILAFLDFTV